MLEETIELLNKYSFDIIELDLRDKNIKFR